MTTNNTVRVALADTMSAAASVFLASLNDRQREAANWTFPSDDERRLWFYTPTDHGGLPLNAMTPAQQQLAFKLVSTGLSRAAYVTVSTIIGLENTLDELEGWVSKLGSGTRSRPGLYYLRIFGDPGQPTWSWRFGGHHVSINHTIVDRAVAAVTPCFLGADPASSPLLGTHPLRPLAGAEDLGRGLVRSLTDTQRTIAVVSDVAPVDLSAGIVPRIESGNLPQPLSEIWRGHFAGELSQRVQTMHTGLGTGGWRSASPQSSGAIHRRAKGNLGNRASELPTTRTSFTPRCLPPPDARRASRTRGRKVCRRPLGATELPVGGQPRTGLGALLPDPGTAPRRRI